MIGCQFVRIEIEILLYIYTSILFFLICLIMILGTLNLLKQFIAKMPSWDLSSNRLTLNIEMDHDTMINTIFNQ